MFSLKEVRTNIPKRWRGTFDRAQNDLSEAVKLKCLDCMNFESAEIRVKECTCTLCPLHSFRPFQEDAEICQRSN